VTTARPAPAHDIPTRPEVSVDFGASQPATFGDLGGQSTGPLLDRGLRGRENTLPPSGGGECARALDGVVVTGLGRTPSGVATTSHPGPCSRLIRNVSSAAEDTLRIARIETPPAYPSEGDLNDEVAAMSDEVEVVVTIEPDFLDFQTAFKALGNVGRGEWWQLVQVGLINGAKIGERTVLQLAQVRRFTQLYGSWAPRSV
jgi:hypothetical protein